MANKITRRATFSHNADRYVTIENTDGGIEIYKVIPDCGDADGECAGLEMFQGFIQDLAVPGIIRRLSTAALYSRKAEVFRSVQLTLSA